ncbi:MAG TPA: hypothetical protein VF718_10645 [Allosphingosinicella sp.]|jgi:uncharacterized protein YlxW (UPF0749 family)
MNPFEMVAVIVVAVMVASVLRAKYGHGRRGRHGEDEVRAVAENSRLKEEVQSLRDRLAVLERITIEKESSLEREIEKLRDR